jgi:hypothetical protein
MNKTINIRQFGPLEAHVNNANKTITLRLNRKGPGAYQVTDNCLSSLVSWAVSEYQQLVESGYYFDFTEVQYLINRRKKCQVAADQD